MTDIYERQLTARGAGPTPRTARGSNHFLSGTSGSSSSPLGAAASRLISSRRSMHGGSTPMLRSARASASRSSLLSTKRWASPSRTAAPLTNVQRALSRSSSLRATVSGALYDTPSVLPGGNGDVVASRSNKPLNPMLASGFRGSAKLPRSMLPEPSARRQQQQHIPQNNTKSQYNPDVLTTRTRDRRMNRSIVSSMKKSRQGVGPRLLAPTEPTKEELQIAKQKLKTLQKSLREKLSKVNEDLSAETVEIERKKSLESKYASLEQELDRLEVQMISTSRSDHPKQNGALQEDPDIIDAIREANEGAPTDNRSLTLGKFDDPRFAQANESFERVQGCTMGHPYHKDEMTPNSHAFNGQQEIGGGPHAQFLSPIQERSTIVASRYYPAGSSPEASKGDDGIYWPFEEPKKAGRFQKKARRVAPVAAYVSSLVQGGYGSVLIDGKWTEGGRVDRRSPQISSGHQKPSRWAELDPAADVDSMERAGVVPGTPSGTSRREWRPVVGAKCNARFPGNREYYLARIEELTPEGLRVRFLSRGNDKEAVVLPSNVKPVYWNRPLTAQWDRDL